MSILLLSYDLLKLNMGNVDWGFVTNPNAVHLLSRNLDKIN